MPSEIYVGLTAQKLADDLVAVATENQTSTEELAEIFEKILFEPGEYELPAEDGTWLKITSAKLNDGGWITAISDITTEKNKKRNCAQVRKGLSMQQDFLLFMSGMGKRVNSISLKEFIRKQRA